MTHTYLSSAAEDNDEHQRQSHSQDVDYPEPGSVFSSSYHLIHQTGLLTHTHTHTHTHTLNLLTHEYKSLIQTISAVKKCIVINHIQNTSFCLHNTCACTVYNYVYIYIYTHMHLYI